MSTSEGVDNVCGRSPLDDVAREQMVGRLREALELAQAGLADLADLGHFDELLCAVQDQSQALEAARSAASERRGPGSVLARAELRPAGEPVREFLLIPFGEVQLERPCAGGGFVFTPAHAAAARRWFEGLARKLAIDYEHQSFDRFNTRPDGLRPAAGWIGGLEVRDDGLWATDVTWTDRAAELLRSGEYRYFSPVIFWTDEEQTDVAALGPVALTNDPAMCGVMPLAARRGDAAADTQASGDEPAADDDRGECDCTVAQALAAAREEIACLKRQLAGQAADAFVERGMRLGKIVDSTSMEWREEHLRDGELAEQRLARSPVLLPPGRMLALDRRGEVAPLQRAEQRAAGGSGARPEIAAEDYEAYERAVADGRVLGLRVEHVPLARRI